MSATGVGRLEVIEIRSALEAGASPAAALAGVRSGPLAATAAAARMGRPVGELAQEIDTGDPHADLLVRALALTEHTGAGGAVAVEQVLEATAAEEQLTRLLRARTAQARMSTWVLTILPLVLWTVLVGLDPAALRFYGTGWGMLSAIVAVSLAAAGWWWSRRLVARSARAADDADPLTPARPRPETGRALAVAVPVMLVTTWSVGAGTGLALGALTATVAARPRKAPASAGAGTGDRAAPGTARPAGGAAETVELLAVALRAGLAVTGAIDTVTQLAPPAARPLLRQAAGRLDAGWDAAEAFAGTPLAEVGAVLAATGRWGAPAHPALRHLAADIRAARRAAAEEAAERAQVSLIFPTTLLTLPAFVAALVPPLVWRAFAG